MLNPGAGTSIIKRQSTGDNQNLTTSNRGSAIVMSNKGSAISKPLAKDSVVRSPAHSSTVSELDDRSSRASTKSSTRSSVQFTRTSVTKTSILGGRKGPLRNSVASKAKENTTESAQGDEERPVSREVQKKEEGEFAII